MSFTPIEFSQVSRLYNFIKSVKTGPNDMICRAYLGDIYLSKAVVRYLTNCSQEAANAFYVHNKALLKPRELNKAWSLLYLPNFEAFIHQVNTHLYHQESLNFDPLTTKDSISFSKTRFNNASLFDLLKTDLTRLQARLSAFTQLNRENSFFNSPLSDTNLAELSQPSANYLPTLYKDFLRITFLQQLKLKQKIHQSKALCANVECQNQLQEWMDEIDANNALIKDFINNGIARMRANQALKNAIKIKSQLLMDKDLLQKSIREQKESSHSLQKTMDWLIPTTVWGGLGLFFVVGIIALAPIMFLQVSVAALITLCVLYIVSMCVAGFISPNELVGYLDQKINDHVSMNERLELEAQFLDNYSKVDKHYLENPDPHKQLVDALYFDLNEMDACENELFRSKNEGSNLKFFSKYQQAPENLDNNSYNTNTI